MIKKLLSITFILFFVASELYSQGGIWTWMKGDSTVFNGVQLGNYGTLGVSSPTNEPPGRYHSNYWKDLQGNFWLSNGQIYNVGSLNDLWKYDIATNEWTWMKGPQIVTNTGGVFGTQGVPNAANYPPSGGLSGYNWTDANNNLWQYHSYGDVWKYSIATNEWTWVKGTGVPAQVAVYGTQGVPNIANTPGYHSENKCSYIDANGNLWCYLKGNMWKYEIATNMWTWMKGPGSGAVVANYGTLGVPSPSNQPALTQAWTYWQDINYNFYLGFSAYNTNAVWQFNPTTNMWTWIKGSQGLTGSANGGVFIAPCVTSNERTPGKRIEARGGQFLDPTSCSDVLWFCGGSNAGMYNDLWYYNPTQNQWTWVSGDSTSGALGNYGIQGVPASTNMLPCRQGHAMWVDNQQQVWVFGGIVRGNTSRANDLWRFTPDPSCFNFQLDTSVLVPPVDTVLCLSESTSMNLDTSLSITIAPAQGYVFNLDSSMVTFTPSTTTTYTVTGTKLVNNCPVQKSIVFTIIVNDYQLPNFANASICFGDTASISLDTSYIFTFTPNATNYQPGDSVVIFNPTVTTTYTVTATKNGCPINNTGIFTINVSPLPIASFVVSPEFVEISNALFTLANTSTNAVSYQWFIGTQSIGTNQNESYLATDTGEVCFTLVAFNDLGCSDTTENCGTVFPGFELFIPNAFSPNGDGNNDIFKIIGKNIRLKSFMIYDRWGERVFESDDINFGWNGKINGKDAELGVYFYYIEFENLKGESKVKKGDVTLMR